MLTDDIVTPRLMLRSTREAWGPLCVDIWLDEEMGKYLADPPRDKAGDAYADFGKGIESQEGWFPFTVFSRESGEFVGTCSVVPTEEGGCWDLGYAVHKRFWRRGYCTEMLTALMDWAMQTFCALGVSRIEVKVADGNAAALRFYEKYGFRMNAHILVRLG